MQFSSNGIDWFEKRSLIHPDKIAVTYKNENWTYQQVNQRAANLASFLVTKGIVRGDRVALLSPNHISYFDLLFACMKIGAIFVPLNWRLTADELSQIIEDCSPKVIFFHDVFEETIKKVASFPSINVNDLAYQQNVSSSIYPLPRIEIDGSEALVILYTGGTTGKSKGAVLSHRSILTHAANTIVSWNLTANDVTPVFLPMFHSGGLNSLTTPLLHIGGRIVLFDKFVPEEAIESLNNGGCTVCLLVPTMYQMLIQQESFQHADFHSMHTFISGGAPCPHSVYDAFLKKGAAFKEGYGLTEAGPNNFYIHPKDATLKIGSVGRPMMYNEVKIVNEQYVELPDGEIGEIILKGHHLFENYWQNEAATKEAFVDGWFKTGDYGRKDSDGYYYIVGRKKEMFISGGENIYPTEIENVLIKYPGIDEVCVIGLPDEKWGEIGCAVVVCAEGQNITTEDLKKYCEPHLSRYKVPKKFIFANQLPKTPVGKIDKKSLIFEHSISNSK